MFELPEDARKEGCVHAGATNDKHDFFFLDSRENKRDNAIKIKNKNRPLRQHFGCYLTNQQMFQSRGFKSGEGIYSAHCLALY